MSSVEGQFAQRLGHPDVEEMYVMNGKFLGAVSFLIGQSVTTVCFADNPIVQTIFTADPAPMVHDGVFYVYTGHDEDGAGWFDMREWRVYSTTDMVNWTDLGSPMDLRTFDWANVDAWAAQCVYRNDRFYYYVPIRLDGDWFGIGVGVSDTPAGPFTDAIGAPLIEGNAYIDPTVFVDDDGQAYMYWGNGHLWMARLNEDMVSISGDVTEIPRTSESFDDTFGEGPWLTKREGLYYLLFASLAEPGPGIDRNMENIRYSTSSSPTGPWEYAGMIMPAEGGSWTNHPGIADYKGNSYFVYHNAALPGGGDGQRSVCVEHFEYNDDGSIPQITMTTEGPDPVDTLDPFARVEAETIAWESGVETEPCSEGGVNATDIDDGDYIKVREVEFGGGPTSFDARVASASGGGAIELRLDSEDGTLVGTCMVESTGGERTWATQSCPISGAAGKHDLFLKFTGGGFKFNWWQFVGPQDSGTGGVGGEGGTAGRGGSQSVGGAVDTGGSGGGMLGGTSPTGGATTGAAPSSGGARTGGDAGTGAAGLSGSTGGIVNTGGTNVDATGGSGATGGTTAGTGGLAAPIGGTPTGAAGTGADAPLATDPSRSSDGGGCGCRVASGGSRPHSLFAFAVLGLLVLRSSRRRADARRVRSHRKKRGRHQTKSASGALLF